MIATLPASFESSEAVTLRRYATAAGVAMLVTMIFGFLGEVWIPGRFIVHADTAATAANILAHPTLFRLGFASYFVEGCCDIALCVLFYVILKPVNRNLALLSAFFGIASMAIFAVAESSYWAASMLVRDSAGFAAFTAEQRNALAYFALRLYGTIGDLFFALYGIASMLRGYLIMRSGYLPRILGVLLMIGGAGFVVRTASVLLAPSYTSDLMLLPMAVAGIPLMLWLLFRGGGILSAAAPAPPSHL
jgi:hypothetical protein